MSVSPSVTGTNNHKLQLVFLMPCLVMFYVNVLTPSGYQVPQRSWRGRGKQNTAPQIDLHPAVIVWLLSLW